MRIALLFNFAFSILIISLAGSTAAGVPIKYVAWPTLIAAIILSAMGVRKILKARRKTVLMAGAILMFVSVAFAIGPNALRGGFPSDNPDCWAYAAMGQYFKDFPRGSAGGLSYIDQYASGLSGARFAAASLLGFLSKILSTNTARVLVVFEAIVLVNCFLGCFSVTRAFGASSITSLASAIFFTCNGWTIWAVRVAQLDNLIFLGLGLFALTRTLLLFRNVDSNKALIGIGANVAAAGYAYPEGVAIAASFSLPFAVATLSWFLRDYRRRQRKVILIVSCCVLLLAPYLPTFANFLLAQVSTTSGSIRPGAGALPGLTIDRLFPAFFGFGEEISKIRIETWRFILPALLSILILLGVSHSRFRRATAASLCLLVAAVGFELIYFQYDYAAYKLIFVGTIIWIPMIFVGVGWLADKLRPHGPNFVAGGFATVILGGSFAQTAIDPYAAVVYHQPLTDERRIPKYEEIKNLRRLIGDSTLAIACSDPFKYLWTYYFSRKLSVQLLDYKSYFNYSIGLLRDARKPTDPARFILTDQPGQQAVWTNGQFWLFRLSEQPRLMFSQSDNGLEELNGEAFTWIGHSPTKFEIISATAGEVRFSCIEIVDGPSLPGKVGRSVKVSIDGQTRTVSGQDLYALDFAIGSGVTPLEISCLDAPTRLRQENGDTRIMLVGLKGFRIRQLGQ